MIIFSLIHLFFCKHCFSIYTDVFGYFSKCWFILYYIFYIFAPLDLLKKNTKLYFLEIAYDSLWHVSIDVLSPYIICRTHYMACQRNSITIFIICRTQACQSSPMFIFNMVPNFKQIRFFSPHSSHICICPWSIYRKLLRYDTLK